MITKKEVVTAKSFELEHNSIFGTWKVNATANPFKIEILKDGVLVDPTNAEVSEFSNFVRELKYLTTMISSEKTPRISEKPRKQRVKKVQEVANGNRATDSTNDNN